MDKNEFICVPGQRLCLCDDKTISGQGTYERQGYIYSKLAGLINVSFDEKNRTIEVVSLVGQSIVPTAGDIVTAKVTIVNQRVARCIITCIGDNTLSRTYRGILRKEDVRASEKDRVDLYKSVRPGDVILARVMPLTELHCYQLSTAENELGVVVAMSPNGIPMVPVSWTEMQCPNTFVKQPRKVARVVPESFAETPSAMAV